MIKIMRYLEEDYFRYLSLTYSLNSIYACAILLFIVYVLYLTTVNPLTDRPTMQHDDQSPQKQKIRAEDVAYAAFHDTVFDVGEELDKYDECAALSGTKLQTALAELDVLKCNIDTAYELLLSVALSPLSSRLRRCKANIDIRIAEMKDYLTSNVTHTATAQKELCDTSDESSVTVASTDCDDDIVQIDDTSVQRNCTDSNSKQPSQTNSDPIDDLTVEPDKDCYGQDTVQTDDAVQIDDLNRQSNSTDSNRIQPCQKNPDHIDDYTVGPDEDQQVENDTVSYCRTNDELYTELNMTILKIAECCPAAETGDLAYECCSISGLKHRWRWKL